MSKIQVDSIVNKDDTGGVDFPKGVTVTGVVTATSFAGNVTGDITIGAGTTSAPSLAPSGDSNTGVFFPSADTIAFAEGGVEAARIDSSGRLLVGTTTVSSDSTAVLVGRSDGATSAPNLRLEANFTPADGNSLGALLISQTGQTGQNASARIEARRDGGTWTSGTSMPGRLVFYTTADGASSPTERMRIDSDGYLKASRDGTYFSVSENNHSFENSWDGNLIARMYHGGTSGNQYGLEITTANDQNNGTNHFFQCVGGSTVRARFKSSGGLSNYQANDTNLCDEREKKNIVDLDSTWDCLKQWELKKFHYNQDADTDDKKYGVIAQQIAPHCPEVIDDWVKQEAKEAVLDDDGNVVTPAVEEIVRMGVKEQQMMWMAIKALQEAQTRIEELESQNAAILARLDALEAG